MAVVALLFARTIERPSAMFWDSSRRRLRRAATEDCVVVLLSDSLSALPSPRKAAAKASHRGASRHCVAVNVKSFVLFGGIPLLQQKVQLGALRWVPARAGVPRTGHGEAPVQHPKPNSRANSRNPPFSPGGEGERAPPRRPAAAPP